MFPSLTFAYIWVSLMVLGSIVWVGAVVWQYFKQVVSGNLPEWLVSILFVPIFIALLGVIIGILLSPLIVPTIVDNLHYGPHLHTGMTRNEIRVALNIEHRTEPGPARPNSREFYRLSGTKCYIEYDGLGKLKSYTIFVD